MKRVLPLVLLTFALAACSDDTTGEKPVEITTNNANSVNGSSTDMGMADSGQPQDSGASDAGADMGSAVTDVGPDAATEPDMEADMGAPVTQGDFCIDGWCWERPSLLGSTLTAVWGSADDDVWVVGTGGTVLHYDGAEWGLVDTGLAIDFTELFGFAADDIWATGRSGKLAHFDGTRWSEVTSGTTEHLHAVWGATPDDVYFVGGRQTILHWNGTQVSTIETGQNVYGYTAIWGSSASDIWVGGENNLAKYYDGTTWEWTGGILEQYSAVNTIWGTGTDDIYAAGSNEASHWDGTMWRPIRTDDWLNPGAIGGTSPDDVWLVGGQSTMHWDGTEWTTSQELDNEFIMDAWMEADGDGWAVGSSGRILRLDAGTWSAVSGVERGIYGGNGDIHAVAENDVWIAANDHMLHWNGTDWNQYEQAQTQYFQPFSTVYAAGPTSVWAGGWGNAPASIQRFDGTAFQTVPRTDGVNYINAIWGAAPDDVYFVGDDSSVLHWNGTEVEVVFYNVASIQMYMDIDGAAANDIWVIGDGGATIHYDGQDWDTSIDSGTSEDLGVLHVAASDDVWAAGFWQNVLIHWDGQSWTSVTPPPVGADLNGNRVVRALYGEAGDLYAAGAGGGLFHWNGATWTHLANFGVSITGIDATDDAIWVVGNSHAVLRKAR